MHFECIIGTQFLKSSPLRPVRRDLILRIIKADDFCFLLTKEAKSRDPEARMVFL